MWWNKVHLVYDNFIFYCAVPVLLAQGDCVLLPTSNMLNRRPLIETVDLENYLSNDVRWGNHVCEASADDVLLEIFEHGSNPLRHSIHQFEH